MQRKLEKNFGSERYERKIRGKQIEYFKFEWSWDKKLCKGHFKSERGIHKGGVDTAHTIGIHVNDNFESGYVRAGALDNRIKACRRMASKAKFLACPERDLKYSSPNEMVRYYKSLCSDG